MTNKRRTSQIRINKTLKDELDLKFPDVRKPDLIQVMWDTSALKLEAKLRKRRR